MQQKSIHNFLTRFFDKTNCEIIENDGRILTTQLTIDMDKKLMNRPFYWHYLEKVGGVPNPASITFVTELSEEEEIDNRRMEFIHFGSPRLHQIFHTTRELGSFVRVYQKIYPTLKQEKLIPWIGINFKISYQCDRTKETFLSLGINLFNGVMVDSFQERMNTLTFTQKIPDYCYTIEPTITIKSGIVRIKNAVYQMIQNDNHDWAKDSISRWKEDSDLLEKFYMDMDEKPQSYEVEKEALKQQYEPRVVVEMMNGGLFYLKHEN